MRKWPITLLGTPAVDPICTTNNSKIAQEIKLKHLRADSRGVRHKKVEKKS